MANYELYGADGVTPIAVKQPDGATWTSVIRGSRPNGMESVGLTATATWVYDTIPEASLNVIENARLTVPQNFKTWRKAKTGSPAGYVKCQGILRFVISGGMVDGKG